VPVGNPVRTVPGTEPPSYGLAVRTPTPQAGQLPVPQPTIQYTERPEPPRLAPTPVGSRFVPGSESGIGALPAPVFTLPPAPVGVPTLTPPPVPKPIVVAPPMIPVLPDPPASVAVKEPGPVAPPALPKPEPVAALPPLPSVLPPLPAPVPSVEPVKAPVPVTEPKPMNVVPAPLPTSVTTNPPREELRWQQSAEPATPAPGTWAPAPGAAPLPTMPSEAAPGGHTGRAPVAPVARGQMGDKAPDPVTTLIKQVCQGRADGVEVRWAGTKKLSVCFEIRTAAAAQKLVNDISRRPELTAYQIDFCALVK
jgi:hypothetical protein